MLRLLAFLPLTLLSWLIRHLPSQVQNGSTLVMRLDASGDFFIWLRSGAQHLMQHAARHGRTTLLANQEWADHARELKFADEVIAVDIQRFCTSPLYRIRMLYMLRHRGFSYVIQPRPAREIWLEDWIALAIGAPMSVCAAGIDKQLQARYRRWTDRWYQHILPTSVTAHAAEQNLSFASKLCGEPVSVSPPLNVHNVSILDTLPKHYFVLAPGAKVPKRRWPTAYFTIVAEHIIKTHKLSCVLIGTEKESILCKAIMDSLPAEACVDLSGQTNLSQVAMVIAGATLILGNESAPVHIASSHGVPAVAILGGGHFGWFIPSPAGLLEPAPRSQYHPMSCFHCHWDCIYSTPPDVPYPCIAAVSQQQVTAAVDACLASSSMGKYD